MVFFSGMWKANHRYDNDDDNDNDYERRNEERERPSLPSSSSPATKKKRLRTPTKRIKPQKFARFSDQDEANDDGDENVHDHNIPLTLNQINEEEKEENETSILSSNSSMSTARRNRRRIKVPVSNYVSSVLFGGLWARSDAMRRRQQQQQQQEEDQALADTADDRRYGTVTFEDVEGASSSTSDLQNHTSDNGDDDDEDSNFPSLTSVFNPDEIDWKVLRICLLYLAAYALVAIVAYCFVFEHWTIIDALYFATATFTTGSCLFCSRQCCALEFARPHFSGFHFTLLINQMTTYYDSWIWGFTTYHHCGTAIYNRLCRVRRNCVGDFHWYFWTRH